MIWLHDALALAVRALGSVALAKALLTEWLAAGKLPWSCMAWNPLDLEGMEELVDRARDVGMLLRDIPPACREGEPEFWRTDHTIRWEDNIAHQNSVVGARALGVKVSREHLLALLPEEPREHVEELGQTQPTERKLLEPKTWLAEVCKNHPRQRNEQLVTYADRLYDLMQGAHLTKPWTFKTLLRRLHDNKQRKRAQI